LLKLAGIALAVLLLSGTGLLPYVDAQTKYLTYQNKQYGFSIKYPSTWEKSEQLTKSSIFPNTLDIVTFATPSDLTYYGVSLIKDDTIFKGLSGQKFLDKIKEKFVDSFCSGAPPGVTCSTKVVQQNTLTHQNGYSGYLMLFELKSSSDQGSYEAGVVIGFYPDGNDVWIIGVASSSGDEFQQYTNELSTMGNSFTIFSYEGEQTTTSQPSTIAKSGVGTLQINSGYFAASKYKPAELIVSGEIKNYLQGVPLTLKIIKPDKTTTEQNILVTKDGKFKTPIKLDENWPAGSYRIIAKYGSSDLGEVSFSVNTGDTTKSTTQQQTKQETTTTTQSKKYLTYENKKYGFSLKYPSNWQKEEKFEKDETNPDVINLVSFKNLDEANFMLGIIQDDKGTSQKILDEMKSSDAEDEVCLGVPAESNCSAELSEKRLTHKNGYGMHVTTLLLKMTYQQTLLEVPATLTIIPDGKNTWLISTTAFSLANQKELLKEVTSIFESFKISNYKGSTQSSIITEQSTSASSQKQFSLNVKAVQENDQVIITISSPPDSASDIYGIKLTTTTGKIKNYIKVNGWDHKRISDNTVSYQTKSSPLGESDVIKIKLKVDAKKPEIKWEVLSKDQKSLGTGKVKT